MSNQNPVPAQPGMFRSPLAGAASLCLALGSVLGLGSLLCLLDPGYSDALIEKILRSGIRTDSALKAWTVIHIIISLVCFICPAITVWGIRKTLRGDYAQGMNFLSNAARWLLRIVHVSAVLALCLFLFRAGRYLLGLIGRGDWLYQLFASFVMEGLMVVQAVFFYRMLCRFLEACEDCAASIGYTLSSGKLDPYSIPAFAATGLLLLGILGIVLSFDRVVTMTIASDGFKQLYKFIWAPHPGQWFCAGSLLVGAIGDILLALYLKFYKRTSERALFYARRQKTT